MNTQMLSLKTIYGAYLIAKLADRAYGLDSLPSEVSLEVGNFKSQASRSRVLEGDHGGGLCARMAGSK
ncbi:unnamed protein product [Prunus armeniaca]|uniref:Uncharacterized protein n=1 Tax=Prunus armeniaca TaxID=36596 RepID=A0A6J5V7N8_PRUAR|nr:unnamed protein product [Prunus armeniaca]